jgi:DNA-binding transcriptional ArsR family regulator
MVNLNLDRVFAALSDPTRRAIIARLGQDDAGATVSELARPFAMSMPAILKHLNVLGDAGLVARSKTGRTVTCRLTAAPMEDAAAWIDRYRRFWSDRLDRLAAFLEEDTCQTAQASPSAAASEPAPPASSPPGPTRGRSRSGGGRRDR